MSDLRSETTQNVSHQLFFFFVNPRAHLHRLIPWQKKNEASTVGTLDNWIALKPFWGIYEIMTYRDGFSLKIYYFFIIIMVIFFFVIRFRRSLVSVLITLSLILKNPLFSSPPSPLPPKNEFLHWPIHQRRCLFLSLSLSPRCRELIKNTSFELTLELHFCYPSPTPFIHASWLESLYLSSRITELMKFFHMVSRINAIKKRYEKFLIKGSCSASGK